MRSILTFLLFLTTFELIIGQNFVCKEDGLFPDPKDKHRFIECSNGRAFPFECAGGTVFNATEKQCIIDTDETGSTPGPSERPTNFTATGFPTASHVITSGTPIFHTTGQPISSVRPSNPPTTGQPISSVRPSNPPTTGYPISSAGPSNPPTTGHPISSVRPSNPPTTGYPISSAGPSNPPTTGHPISSVRPSNPPTTGYPISSARPSDLPTTGHPISSAGPSNPPTTGYPISSARPSNPPTTGYPISSARPSNPPTTSYPISSSRPSNPPTTGNPISSRGPHSGWEYTKLAIENALFHLKDYMRNVIHDANQLISDPKEEPIRLIKKSIDSTILNIEDLENQISAELKQVHNPEDKFFLEESANTLSLYKKNLKELTDKLKA